MTAPGIQVVLVRLRDETFGVEIACTRKITRMMAMTLINDPAGLIRGVVNVQGQVIVVVDLAAQLGLRPVDEMPKTARILFIELNKRAFGFIVDKVLGVGRAQEKPVNVLDLEKVFLKFMQG